MFLIVWGGGGSSNRNAGRDETVEAGDKSVEAGDQSIETGEKTPQSCYNGHLNGTQSTKTSALRYSGNHIFLDEYIFNGK